MYEAFIYVVLIYESFNVATREIMSDERRKPGFNTELNHEQELPVQSMTKIIFL